MYVCMYVRTYVLSMCVCMYVCIYAQIMPLSYISTCFVVQSTVHAVFEAPRPSGRASGRAADAWASSISWADFFGGTRGRVTGDSWDVMQYLRNISGISLEYL